MLNGHELYAFELCQFTLTSIRNEHNAGFSKFSSMKGKYLEMPIFASGIFKVPTMTNALLDFSLSLRGALLLNFLIAKKRSSSHYYVSLIFTEILWRAEKQMLVSTNLRSNTLSCYSFFDCLFDGLPATLSFWRVPLECFEKKLFVL